LRKLAIIGLTLTALLAVTGVAVAQFAPAVIQFTGVVTPNKGGTKTKPKNAKLSVAFTVNKESHKTLSSITYFVPANVKLSGKGFPYCPSTKINAQGEAKCPKGSKIGSGTATAVLGPQQTPLNFTVNVYAGSKSEIAVALKGAVNIAFKAPITSTSAPYGQKIAVAIPASVQSPAPGLYSYVTSVNTTIGGKFVKTVTKRVHGVKKKIKTTYNFDSLTGCPSGGLHKLGVQLGYAANDAGPAGSSDVISGTSACSK
jgi:hypothetical protein